jgi:hypothetical protein
MFTFTAPCAVGVTSNVYVVPEPEKLPIVPLDAVMSPTVKPVTDSENVAVNGIGEAFVAAGADDVIVTVGAVVSIVNADTARRLL